MKKNETVVLTTLFQQPPLYIDEYFESMACQTFQQFDLLVVNDGFSGMEVVKAKYPSINIIELIGSGIAKNRELLINSAIELGYRQAVFADFDDFFSLNRVAILVNLLDEFDVVVNDLAIVVNHSVVKEKHLGGALQDNQPIFLQDILESNFLGMSNTAVKLSCLEKVSFDEDLKAVDWFFFSKLLSDGASAIFTSQCVTYYRQHENSLANIGQVTVHQLLNELAIKRNHYSLLVPTNAIYEPLLAGVSDFNQRINSQVFANYYALIKENSKPPFWWNLFTINDYWRIKNETDR